MTGSIIPLPNQFELSTNGNLLVSGQLFTYELGTSDPKTTYSDQALTATNTNPIIFDSIGRLNVYGDGAYTFLLEDPDGNEIFRRDTSSFIKGSDISPFMLTVNAAEDAQAAQIALGIPALEAQWAAAISLLPGPTGPQGTIGPTGPQGIQGPAGSTNLNYQIFSSAGSYTWTNPGSDSGTLAIIQGWSDGGGGSFNSGDPTAAAGGPGVYVCVACLLTDLPGSVSGSIGSGGAMNGSFIGSDGQGTTFGSYISLAGGGGGNGNTGIPGAPGYITSIVGLNPVFLTGGFTISGIQASSGSTVGSALGQPTVGYSPTTPWIGSFFGGSGGLSIDNPNAQAPGGGGATGGNGAAGQVRVTVI